MSVRIGLTGGIGSGKSTVAKLFASLGATIIDADQIAREVLAAGSVGLERVVAEFGEQVLTSDGQLDRPALAALAFASPEAKAKLDAIAHPLIIETTGQRFAEAGDSTVVHDIPLLTELGLAAAYTAVVVVECPVELRVQRLLQRGLTEEDARARIAAQASDEQRRAIASYVIDNAGDESQLEAQVKRVWQEIHAAGQTLG